MNSTGVQGLGTKPPSGTAGIRPQAKAGRGGGGGWFKEMAKEVWNLEGGTQRGRKGC